MHVWAEVREGPVNLFHKEGLQSKAIIFHYEYKSHKELLKKGLRGRADMRMSMDQRKARMREDVNIDTCCPHPEHRAWEKLKKYLPHYQIYDRPVQVQVNLRAV
ncbi:unnamed protein product [Durusdinium trenchii]|uniref:Uncharacterized protein n=1 Tax=Durusdinium trenchii TaxID=1381693 RepID=A0ABP0NDU5_9DINO